MYLHHDLFGFREEWLCRAVAALAQVFAEVGYELPPLRVSIGWTSRGRGPWLAECWPRTASSIGVNEIFVAPTEDDSVRILDHLTHDSSMLSMTAKVATAPRSAASRSMLAWKDACPRRVQAGSFDKDYGGLPMSWDRFRTRSCWTCTGITKGRWPRPVPPRLSFRKRQPGAAAWRN